MRVVHHEIFEVNLLIYLIFNNHIGIRAGLALLSQGKMADSLVPVLRRPSRKIHIRNQFIFYLGKVVNEIPLTIPFLKDIAKNPDFEELLSRVSGSGSQKLTRLLKRIARDRNAKRVQRAKTIKTKKRAAAPIDRLGGTKRAKLPSDLPGDCGEEADYERSAESEPPPPYSMNSILKSLSPNAFMSGGHNDNSNPSQRMSHDKEMSELGDEDGLETRINLHSGPSVFDGSNAQQRAGEEDNKSSIDGNGHELGGPFDMDQLTRREAYDKYTEELAVTRRDPQVKASIEAHCCNSFAAESKSQREKLSKEVDNVFSTVEQLDFLVVKARLLEYLKERREKSGSKLETPSTWTMSEPRQILGALRTLKTISNDANIHRAFGQMKLLGLVESKVEAQKQLESGHDTIRQCKGKQRGACYTYLEELARKEAGTASKHETASIYRFYLSEYHAGERWLEVAETFGGLGIVLIFITAGNCKPQDLESLLSH